MDGFERYVGLVFDNRYKIERIIGIGGMAVVYKAIDLLMRRVVAVKMLKDEVAADEQSVKRFINESKSVAMLSHPNIVNIYDVSVRDNVKYIVMEYVEGITLKNYMTHKGVLSFNEIVSYSEQILSALEHAHAKGIVHRDIKPQNIMLLKNGLIKVMDFGIAKLPNAETVTMTDKAIGTVYYISPEQASGQPIDARSDLYSLGVLMYEMGCGRLPFNADSPVSVALMQVNDVAVPPRKLNPSLPLGLEQIITRAMEKDPKRRYQNASMMLRQVTRLKENPNIVFREVTDGMTKKKKKKPHRASHAMLPIILGVVFAFLLVAGVSAYYVLDRLFFNKVDVSETIEIPNFVGTVYSDELKQWFEKSEYYNLTLREAYDTASEAGVIISQTPGRGERRKVIAGKQKCDLTLTVSVGAETVQLPDVMVSDYRSAEEALRALGLSVRTERVYSETFEVGTVIRTEPPAGSIMKLGELVKIYASNGPAIGSVVVPNFVGSSEVETLRQLISAGLRVGAVEYEQSEKAAGTVLTQSVRAFSMAYANTTVDFTVSGGPDYRDPNAPPEPEEPDLPDEPTEPHGTASPFDDDPGGLDTTPDTILPPDVLEPEDPYEGWEPEDGFDG